MYFELVLNSNTGVVIIVKTHGFVWFHFIAVWASYWMCVTRTNLFWHHNRLFAFDWLHSLRKFIRGFIFFFIHLTTSFPHYRPAHFSFILKASHTCFNVEWRSVTSSVYYSLFSVNLVLIGCALSLSSRASFTHPGARQLMYCIIDSFTQSKDRESSFNNNLFIVLNISPIDIRLLLVNANSRWKCR